MTSRKPCPECGKDYSHAAWTGHMKKVHGWVGHGTGKPITPPKKRTPKPQLTALNGSERESLRALLPSDKIMVYTDSTGHYYLVERIR